MRIRSVLGLSISWLTFLCSPFRFRRIKHFDMNLINLFTSFWSGLGSPVSAFERVLGGTIESFGSQWIASGQRTRARLLVLYLRSTLCHSGNGLPVKDPWRKTISHKFFRLVFPFPTNNCLYSWFCWATKRSGSPLESTLAWDHL